MGDTVEGAILACLLIALFLLGLAVFWFISRLQGFNLSDEITKNDNPAVGIRYALFALALVVSFSQVIYRSESFGDNLEVVLEYGLPVIAVIAASLFVNEFLILYGFHNNIAVVEGKNTAVAVVEGSTYLATSFIVSSTLVGLETDFAESVTWLLIGQLLLIGIAFVYRQLVPSVFDALDRGNNACALSLGGLLISGGLALGAAVSGESSGWGNDLRDVSLFLVGWLAIVGIAHFLADLVALPSVRLRAEVMEQSNIAAGVIEAVFFIGFTLLYTYVVG